MLLQGRQGLRRPLLQLLIVAGLRVGAEQVHRRLVRLHLLPDEGAVELRALRPLQLLHQRLVLLVQGGRHLLGGNALELRQHALQLAGGLLVVAEHVLGELLDLRVLRPLLGEPARLHLVQGPVRYRHIQQVFSLLPRWVTASGVAANPGRSTADERVAALPV